MRTEARNGEHFTFSSIDVWTLYYVRRLTKPSCLLRMLALFVLLSQLLVVYKATVVHSDTASGTLTVSASRDFKISSKRSSNTFASDPLLSNATTTTRSKVFTVASTTSKSATPRILIGIVSNANNHVGKQLRNRHRQLFELWNETRLCPYKDFRKDPFGQSQCQILYTFVIGAHNSTSQEPPLLVDDSRPLELDSIPLMPRYKDVQQSDVTILNIQENMNQGKSPTFLYWAWKEATVHQSQHNIQYVVKCDSDAMIRHAFLLRMLHRELPWNPSRSLVLGAFRHKTTWENMTANEEYWKESFYNGMHLYLGGQFYMMSMDVAHAVIQQARHFSTLDYLEGHEDHDTLSMAHVQVFEHNPELFIRWIGMPKNYRFWEHPVKGDVRKA